MMNTKLKIGLFALLFFLSCRNSAAIERDFPYLENYYNLFYCLNLKYNWSDPINFPISRNRDSIVVEKMPGSKIVDTFHVQKCHDYARDSNILLIRVTKLGRLNETVVEEYQKPYIKTMEVKTMRFLIGRYGIGDFINGTYSETWASEAIINGEKKSVFYSMRLQKDFKSNTDWYYLESIFLMHHPAFDYEWDYRYPHTTLKEHYRHLYDGSKSL
jgi:hypothetical protein